MPRFYGVMIHDNGDSAIANFGANAPARLPVPNRESDFPPFQLPVAEEARIYAINRLFPNWVEHTERAGLIRINDDGTIDARLLDKNDLEAGGHDG
jgi:hypothetical protein